MWIEYYLIFIVICPTCGKKNFYSGWWCGQVIQNSKKKPLETLYKTENLELWVKARWTHDSTKKLTKEGQRVGNFF